MAAKVGQQALATLGRQLTDFPQQRRLRQHRKKSQADERCRLESAGGKFLVIRPDCLVKARDPLLELCADAADEEIAEWGQLPEQNDGTVLDLAVGLGQRGEGDIAFVHGRRSAAVYSGSFSP